MGAQAPDLPSTVTPPSAAFLAIAVDRSWAIHPQLAANLPSVFSQAFPSALALHRST